MTRRSRRSLERDVEELSELEDKFEQPFSDEEIARYRSVGIDVDAWSKTETRRAMLRALEKAAQSAE